MMREFSLVASNMAQRLVPKRLSQLYADMAYDSSYSIESGLVRETLRGSSRAGRKMRYTIMAGAGLVLLCFAYMLTSYWSLAVPMSDAARFLHSAERALLTRPPSDGSTWMSSREVSDEWMARMPLDKIFLAHERHLIQSQLPCVAPILYGENIRLLSTSTHLHLINPHMIDASDARAWYMDQQSSALGRVNLFFEDFEQRSQKKRVVPLPDFPLFAEARARRGTVTTVRRNEYVWVSAIEWPSMERKVFELSGDVSYCVQTMIYWFRNGDTAPMSKSAYSETMG